MSHNPYTQSGCLIGYHSYVWAISNWTGVHATGAIRWTQVKRQRHAYVLLRPQSSVFSSIRSRWLRPFQSTYPSFPEAAARGHTSSHLSSAGRNWIHFLYFPVRMRVAWQSIDSITSVERIESVISQTLCSARITFFGGNDKLQRCHGVQKYKMTPGAPASLGYSNFSCSQRAPGGRPTGIENDILRLMSR